MKKRKFVSVVLLVGILLVGVLPAQVLYADCGCGVPNTPVTQPKPVDPEPEVPETPVPVGENIVEVVYEDDDDDETYVPSLMEPSSPVDTTVVKNEVKAITVEEKSSAIVFTVGKSSYEIDSKEVEMDGTPFVHNDRMMIPLRYVAEALGMEVSYEDETRTATFMKKDLVIKINVDSSDIVVNDKVYEGDTAPQVIEGRIYVSLGSIAETLGMTREKPESGYDLSWNQETKSATLTTK